MKRQHHINMEGSEGLGKYAILPGDPGRVEPIARHLKDARQITQNREFNTWIGTYLGVPVTVTSTGIGCPSAAIAVQELSNLGVHTFIRLGTAGALQDHVAVGDYTISTASTRRDGTTHMLVPASVPAVADHFVTQALIEAMTASRMPFHVGVCDTKDTFYCEGDGTPVPLAEENDLAWLVLQRAGVLSTSMEAAAIFIVARHNRRRAGELLLNVGRTIPIAGQEGKAQPIEEYDITPGISIVLETIRRLYDDDKRLNRPFTA